MKIELNRDWTEFLCALISRRVRFLVIGGHAVAGHGEPRLTEDLDVFVDRDARNAKRLRDALVDFGFGSVAPLGQSIRSLSGASIARVLHSGLRISTHDRVWPGCAR